MEMWKSRTKREIPTFPQPHHQGSTPAHSEPSTVADGPCSYPPVFLKRPSSPDSSEGKTLTLQANDIAYEGVRAHPVQSVNNALAVFSRKSYEGFSDAFWEV